MPLIRFLLITIFILWTIRFVVRLLLPMLFQSLVNKAQQQGNASQRPQYKPKPEGAIRVDYVPPKDKEAKAADKAGEFVDYEEIK